MCLSEVTRELTFCILSNMPCHVGVGHQVPNLLFVLERFTISALSSVNPFFFFFFKGYETNLLVVENGLPELCFRGRVSSTFVINQERNYIWSKEKKSSVMAGRDEAVPVHRAVNLPAESNHYCQLNHFRLTWRQNGELSAPLPVRKERFSPPFIGMMNK